MNYQSYLLLCDYISKKISGEDIENIWVKELRYMLKKNLSHFDIYTNIEFRNFIFLRTDKHKKIPDNAVEIKYFSVLIEKYIQIILRNFGKNEYENDFKNLFYQLNNLSSGEIIKYFRKKIIRIKNKNGSVYGNEASFYGINQLMKEINEPFLNFRTNKKFTLVLDLDETLISFKIDQNFQNKGMLRLRPGLFQFLSKAKNKYELIVFTSATSQYADPLINAIEKDKKIFEFRLYRQHTIILENEFVKDISKLGRPIHKIIIVDNLPQNFRLQKENGIMIKPFWGKDAYDTALYELGNILEKIANEFFDCRKGIQKYKNEILFHVTSNFSKSGIFK